MLSSAYYLQQYTAHNRLAEKYKNQADYLEPLKSKIDYNFDDDARRVSGKIDNLIDDLKKGVRKNETYTTHAEDLEQKKEHSALSDTKLSAASSALGAEISRLRGLQHEQERLADEAYQNYLAALEEERRAAEAYANSLNTV